MSDISLPPEVLNQIIEEAVIGMRPSERDKNYSSFSLVSKNWTSTATSLLLNSLKVRNGSHMKQVLDGISRSGLGSIVKSLEVKFRMHRDYEDESKELPTLSQINQHNMVSVEQFVQLTRLLPSLTQIKLIRPTFIRFKRQDFKDYPDIFQNLVTFHLDTFYYKIKSEVLANIMRLAPKLNNLELKEERLKNLSSLAPLKKCNPLRSLKSCNFSIDSQLSSLKNPLIPLSSYEGLEELQLSYVRNLGPGYKALVSRAAPTLTSLILSGDVQYPRIIQLLQLLPNLLSIDVYSDQEVEVDFFSHVPLSLSIIKSLEISLPALQYLKSNQRPGLKLHELLIDFSALDSPLELIKALPKSLVVFSTDGHAGQFRNLLEILESLVGTEDYPCSLKTIEGSPYKVLSNCRITRFAKLGISFEEMN